MIKKIYNNMKLFGTVVFPLFGLLVITVSCNKTKTYAEHLKDETRAIERLIAEKKINVLNTFPADSIFKENDFYKDPTGVYFNIIDYGDSVTPGWRENVSVRFKGLYYFKDNDTTRYSNLSSTLPEKIDYIGPVTSNTSGNYSNPGWVVPLSYIGHRGKVKMIIPFSMGSTYDQQSYEPTYYEQVEYRFGSRW